MTKRPLCMVCLVLMLLMCVADRAGFPPVSYTHLGAAGQAVQNMNLMFGFDEAEGLLQGPMYP